MPPTHMITTTTNATNTTIAGRHDDRKPSTMNTIQIQTIDETSIFTVQVARCADGNGNLTPLFFSDHVVDIARALAICATCALAAQCLSDAIERDEPWGVWGGELLSGGRIVANKRPGGRPPKIPGPPVIVDEFGVVEESFGVDDDTVPVG